MKKKFTKKLKYLLVLFIMFFAIINNNAQLSTDANLVAHWPMDEGLGEEVTDVIGSNNGTIIGDNITWLPLYGINLPGIDGNRIEIPNSDAFDFGDVDFTISFRVRYDSIPTTTDRWIIKGTHESPGTGSRYEVFCTPGNTVRFTIDNGPSDLKTKLEVPGATFFTGDWVHVAAVRNATTKIISLYTDGEKLGEIAETSGDISSGEPLWIGESTDELETAMGGDICDVRFYNIALDSVQIMEVSNSAPKSGKIAIWKFDAETGSTAKDELDNSNGTLYNISDDLRVEGLVGNCIDFGSGSSSSYVEVPDNDIIDIEDTLSFSISVLIKISDISGTDQNVLFKGHTDNSISGHWYGIICAQNELRFAVDDANQKTQLEILNANQLMNMGAWNHVVAVRDLAKDSIYIYLNGEKIGEKLDETGTTESGLPLVIGNNPQHNVNFKGKIDELTILNVALTPSEIYTLYKRYFPKPVSVTSWKFDETSGTTAIDEMGKSNGILNNIGDDLRVEGLVGNCIDFGSGTDDSYIEVANYSGIDFDATTSFSVSALVNIADISSNTENIVVFKGNKSDVVSGHWYSLLFRNNQLRFILDDASNQTQLELENASDLMHMDGWNHIVGVRDLQNDMMYIYLNGVKVAERAAGSDNVQSGLPLLIGNGTGHDNQFAGKIDEVHIYDLVLTDANIEKMAAEYGIKRILSSNSSLKEITLDSVTFEGFDPAITEYTVELPLGTISAPIIAAAADDDIAIVSIVPPFGIPGTCNITVTAEDSTTTKYTISFTVEQDTVATLSDLKVDGTTVDGFSSEVTEYALELPAGTTSANVTATATSNSATITGTGDIDIPGTAEIIVTSEDDSTIITYKIVFSNATSINKNFDNSAKVFYNSIGNCLVLQNIDNITKIEIYNISGLKLAVINNAISGKISLNNLNLTTNSMYILKYESEGIPGVLKFIK